MVGIKYFLFKLNALDLQLHVTLGVDRSRL